MARELAQTSFDKLELKRASSLDFEL